MCPKPNVCFKHNSACASRSTCASRSSTSDTSGERHTAEIHEKTAAENRPVQETHTHFHRRHHIGDEPRRHNTSTMHTHTHKTNTRNIANTDIDVTSAQAAPATHRFERPTAGDGESHAATRPPTEARKFTGAHTDWKICPLTSRLVYTQPAFALDSSGTARPALAASDEFDVAVSMQFHCPWFSTLRRPTSRRHVAERPLARGRACSKSQNPKTREDSRQCSDEPSHPL